MNRVLCIVWVLCALSCSNSNSIQEAESVSATHEHPFERLASENIGPTHTTVFNADSSYVLIHRPSRNGAFVSGPFMVYDMTEQDVVFEDQVAQGHLKWISPFVLEVVQVPGIIRGDERDNGRQGYRYHVKQQRKWPLGK